MTLTTDNLIEIAGVAAGLMFALGLAIGIFGGENVGRALGRLEAKVERMEADRRREAEDHETP